MQARQIGKGLLREPLVRPEPPEALSELAPAALCLGLRCTCHGDGTLGPLQTMRLQPISSVDAGFHGL